MSRTQVANRRRSAARGRRRREPNVRPWVVIGALSAVSIAGALQYMLLVPVLPSLPEQLGASPADATWLVTASVLAGTVVTPTISTLSDMFGHRRMILVCLSCIAIGSALGLVTDDVWVLVAARAISGMSNAAVPVAIAIVRDQLPAEQRSRGIAFVSTSGAAGVGLAMPLGGWLNAAFGWQSIFAFMLGIAVLLLVAVPLAIRAGGARLPGRFDIAGAVLLTTALVALLVSISNGAEWGWLSIGVLALLATALVLGAGWFAVERTLQTPLIDLRAAKSPAIVFTNIAGFALGFTMFGNILVMTSQLQVPPDAGGFALDPVVASLLLSIPAFALMLAAAAASMMVPRVGARRMLLAGAALTFAGYGLRFGFLDSLAWIVVGAVIIQLGTAACLAAIPVIITTHAPDGETASANGANILIRSIGSTISSATVAAAFTITLTSPAGLVFPAPQAFLIFFGVAVGCAAIAFVCGLFAAVPKKQTENVRNR